MLSESPSCRIDQTPRSVAETSAFPRLVLRCTGAQRGVAQRGFRRKHEWSDRGFLGFLPVARQTTKTDRLDSAGINRHGVANERVVQGRNSEPPWPRAM